jgi:hypothetical protein
MLLPACGPCIRRALAWAFTLDLSVSPRFLEFRFFTTRKARNLVFHSGQLLWRSLVVHFKIFFSTTRILPLPFRMDKPYMVLL